MGSLLPAVACVACSDIINDRKSERDFFFYFNMDDGVDSAKLEDMACKTEGIFKRTQDHNEAK